LSDLVVRRLLVDMQQPIERNWCAGDAFRSAFFNALSMSFPVGEQFFIDSVKNGLKAVPESEQEPYKKEVQGFVGQEATHRRLHSLYNEHLTQLGYINSWEARIKKNLGMMAQANVRHWLAVTAANEHFTAILAEWLLRNPEVLGTKDERLATLWLWHSAEESEHRCTAFNMYRALGGNEAWRLKWFRRVSAVFLFDVLRQTAANLHKDGALFRFSTWQSGFSFLFGKQGLVRQTYKPWKQYFKNDFHPDQQDDALSREWLVTNSMKFTPVGV
jgi:predicted metal-dependent hydrolase